MRGAVCSKQNRPGKRAEASDREHSQFNARLETDRAAQTKRPADWPSKSRSAVRKRRQKRSAGATLPRHINVTRRTAGFRGVNVHVIASPSGSQRLQQLRR